MRHFNSVKYITIVNLDAAMLASKIGEEQDMPSQSRPIPEYGNLHTSGIIQRRKVQERNKKLGGKPKLFGLIYLFAYVSIFSSNSILPETERFAANLLHYEEKSMSLLKIFQISPTIWYLI